MPYLAEDDIPYEMTDEEELVFAARCDNCDSIERLLNKGVNINCALEGVTPLTAALSEHSFDAAHLLLDRGADGMASIRSAIGVQDKTIFTQILESCVDVNAVDSQGWTLLMSASLAGDITAAKGLIRKGARVNVITDSGITALNNASSCGHTEVVKLLLKHRADVNLRDDGGYSALMWAAINDQSEVIERLATSYLLPALPEAAILGNIDAVKSLLKDGVDISTGLNTFGTLLWWASLMGNLELVRFLSSQGADVNAADDGAETPLMQASRRGHIDLVKLLIANGADITLINKAGKNALGVVAESRAGRCFDFEIMKRYDDIVEVLKTH